MNSCSSPISPSKVQVGIFESLLLLLLLLLSHRLRCMLEGLCKWVLAFWWRSVILSQGVYRGDRTVRQPSDDWHDDVQYTRSRVRVMSDDVVSRRRAPSNASSICKCCSLTSLTQRLVQSTHSVHESSIPQNRDDGHCHHWKGKIPLSCSA